MVCQQWVRLGTDLKGFNHPFRCSCVKQSEQTVLPAVLLFSQKQSSFLGKSPSFFASINGRDNKGSSTWKNLIDNQPSFEGSQDATEVTFAFVHMSSTSSDGSLVRTSHKLWSKGRPSFTALEATLIVPVKTEDDVVVGWSLEKNSCFENGKKMKFFSCFFLCAKRATQDPLLQPQSFSGRTAWMTQIRLAAFFHPSKTNFLTSPHGCGTSANAPLAKNNMTRIRKEPFHCKHKLHLM